MKAIVYTQLGSPDVLQLTEVEKPKPKENQLLIKVHAASVNALDSHMMRGLLPLSQLINKFNSKPKTLGADLAGIVQAVGSKVTKFRVGDEVFGSGKSTFAEYALTREDAVVLKPFGIRYEEGAAVGVAGLTALQGLRDYGKIKAGQKVCINGAGGGLGTFAVQIAKAFGAEVTAVCGPHNVDMVRSIGADHVIDYTQEDFTQSDKRYDLIMQANGYHPLLTYKRMLTPNGTFVLAGTSKDHMFKGLFQTMFLGPVISMFGKHKLRFFIARIKQEDLLYIRGLLESGKIKSVIDRQYPLSEAADAIRYLEEWHSRGKIIITVV